MRLHSLKIRDHIMIAHSFKHELFGPARNLHGATYIIDVEITSKSLSEGNVILNIDDFAVILKDITGDLNLKNLDEHPDLQNEETTTEYMSQYILQRLKQKIESRQLIPPDKLHSIRVTLKESHLAEASCTEYFNN